MPKNPLVVESSLRIWLGAVDGPSARGVSVVEGL